MPIKFFSAVSYDPNVDACYVKVSDTKVVDTLETTEGFFVDVDGSGNILGLEILQASKHFDFINKLIFSATPIQQCVSY